jgi:ectoine hydroxylase-related dioxygenase (phytanoyl-CoA dioxygenase family)
VTWTSTQRSHFDLFGFVVLRALLTTSEIEQLGAEVDGALRDAFAESYASNTRHEVVADGDVAAEGNFLPLMADRAPLSQALVVDDPRLSGIADDLLGDFTVASPALATCLVSDTPWHNDGGLGSRWLRLNAYLQPATHSTGALRVVPGSQDGATSDRIARHLGIAGERGDPDALPGVALETMPGDLIVFDPRIHHGSWGGSTRLRWSVDYLSMPPADDAEAMARTSSLVADLSDWPSTPEFPTWAEWVAHPSERRREAARKLRTLGMDLTT